LGTHIRTENHAIAIFPGPVTDHSD